MKAFFKVKRVGGILWAKMYTDCKGDYHAAACVVNNVKEARIAFVEFVEDIRNDL